MTAARLTGTERAVEARESTAADWAKNFMAAVEEVVWSAILGR